MSDEALAIAQNLKLPAESVTETFAMLAKRGMGKSNAAVVMAEEMWESGYQWVAIDPKGDWWGVRSSADGKGPGLPVPVFGGRHGDIPLEASAGHLMASLIAERGLTCVLDVSLFSKNDQIRYVRTRRQWGCEPDRWLMWLCSGCHWRVTQLSRSWGAGSIPRATAFVVRQTRRRIRWQRRWRWLRRKLRRG